MYAQQPPGSPPPFMGANLAQLMQQGQQAVQALVHMQPNHPQVGQAYNQAMAALQGLMQCAQMGIQGMNMPSRPVQAGPYTGYMSPQLQPVQEGWGSPPRPPVAPAPPPPWEAQPPVSQGVRRWNASEVVDVPSRVIKHP